MTYEERTNLESYLKNIHNLVELKNALQYSLDDASCELYDAVDRLGIETEIKDTINLPNEYEGVNDYFNQTYTKNDDKSIRKDTSLLEIDCEIIRLLNWGGIIAPSFFVFMSINKKPRYLAGLFEPEAFHLFKPINLLLVHFPFVSGTFYITSIF